MADIQDFQIKLVTSADLAAAKAAAGALQDVAKATTAEAQNTEQAAKQTGFLTLRKQELKKVIGDLSREFPLAGQAARLMLNPLVAGITLAIGMFGTLKRAIAEFSANLDLSEWESYGKVTEAKRAQFEAAAQGAAEFARQVERIRTATQTASEASERLVTVFKAQQSAQEKLDDARKRLETARVEAGTSDPVSRQAKLLEIEERYAARQRTREDQTSRFELEQQHKKLANELADAAWLKKEAEAAQERLAKLKSETEISAQLTVEMTRQQTINDDLAAKRAKMKEYDEAAFPPFPGVYSGLGKTIKELESQKAATDLRVSQLRGEASAGITQFRAGQENVSALRQMELGAVQRAKGIASALPTQEAVAGIESKTRGEVGLLDSATRAAGVAAGNQSEVKRLIDSAARQIESTGSLAQGMAQAIERQTEWADQVNAYLKRIEGQIANLRNSR